MEKDKLQTDSEKFPAPTLLWNDVLRVLGSIAGFVGITGAVLWLFGRFYFSGVFSAFGFASLSISLPPEDYLERGSFRFVYLAIDILISILLYYLAYLAKIFYYENISKRIKNRLLNIISILIVFAVSIIAGVVLISTKELGISTSFFFEDTINLISIFLIFLGLEVTYLIAPPSHSENNSQLQNQFVVSSQTPIVIARILIVVVMFASLLFTHARLSFASGQSAGCVTTLRRSTTVVIFSSSPMFIEGETQARGLYRYDGYFLLFADKDNYYLFRDINTDTYRPDGYFVVSKDILKTFQITGMLVSEDENDKYNEMCANKN